MNSTLQMRARLRTEASARQGGAPDWWTALPQGERVVIRSIYRMLRGAKRSQVREVARAAAKWESGIVFFIKVRLKNARRGGLRGGNRL